MKYVKRICLLLVSAMLISAVLCGCAKKKETVDTDPDKAETVSELSFTERSLFLATGDEVSLSLEQKVDSVKYESSNPEAVKVSEDGKVTALKKGNALITATAGEAVAYCGVLVDLTSLSIDVANMDVSAYVDRAILTMPSIHQSFTVDGRTGDVYFLQKYDDTPSDNVVTRYCMDGTQEWMRLIDFGHGSAIAVEYDEKDEVYIWVSSDADINERGSSVSRIKWEPGKVYQQDGGTVYDFPDAQVTPLPYIDEINDLVCVRTRTGSLQKFFYYDLISVTAGEDLIPLAVFEFTGGSTADEPGYYSFQGFATSGRYIYVLEGNPKMQPQIVTWDIEGEMLSLDKIPQPYAAETWNNGYYEPEGLVIVNGKMYFGIATNPGGNRRSSVFYFK